MVIRFGLAISAFGIRRVRMPLTYSLYWPAARVTIFGPPATGFRQRYPDTETHDYPPKLREISEETGTKGTVTALRRIEAPLSQGIPAPVARQLPRHTPQQGAATGGRPHPHRWSRPGDAPHPGLREHRRALRRRPAPFCLSEIESWPTSDLGRGEHVGGAHWQYRLLASGAAAFVVFLQSAPERHQRLAVG